MMPKGPKPPRLSSTLPKPKSEPVSGHDRYATEIRRLPGDARIHGDLVGFGLDSGPDDMVVVNGAFEHPARNWKRESGIIFGFGQGSIL